MQPKESGAGLQKGSLLMGATENTESRRTKKLYALKQAIQSFFLLLYLSLTYHAIVKQDNCKDKPMNSMMHILSVVVNGAEGS